ncbi:MAG: hypothetical protein WB799_01415 [Candidatus Sulfotelmatobacter sp.]
MHVHANQINPNTQLDALYAAEKAAAKRAAESTRKKLLEFASELAGEAESEEGCVVKLGHARKQRNRRSRRISGTRAAEKDAKNGRMQRAQATLFRTGRKRGRR